MKSKTSYFNKAVFKKDMTQFWSLWAVEIVISLLIFIMPLMSSVNGIIREYTGNTLNARSDIKEYDTFIAGQKGNIIYITLYCRCCYASDTVCDRICWIYYSWKDVLCRAYDKSAASGI